MLITGAYYEIKGKLGKDRKKAIKPIRNQQVRGSSPLAGSKPFSSI